MPLTPDRVHGTEYQQKSVYDDRTGDGVVAEPRALFFQDGYMQMQDQGYPFEVRSAFARKTLGFDLTVPDDHAYFTRALVIGDGITLTIEQDAEVMPQ